MPFDTFGGLVEPLAERISDRESIRAQVRARRAYYGTAGLKPEDRVLINFGNRIEFFADLLAIWGLGACAIPVDPRLTPYEMGVLAGASVPKFLISFGPAEDPLREALPDKCHVLDSNEAGECRSEPLERPGFHLDSEALILFTSGTTGSPKGVVHTHRSLQARWQTLEQSLDLRHFERTLCLLPTHFGHGLICNCLFPWLNGCDLYIVPPSNQKALMQLGGLIDTHSITFLSSVPSVWRFALKAARPPERGTLRSVHCGSAPLTEHLWQQVRTWCGTDSVYNAYGITETGSWVAGTTVEGFTPEDGLIGHPWGSQIRIARTPSPDASTGQIEECGTGEIGYVWLKTPALMKGYLDRQDLTSEVVYDGWFVTGDLGMVDENGLLFLRGRKREEINKGGMKVYPSDIDAVVERFAGARDCCAFPFEDPLYGQDIGMALVLENQEDQTIRDLDAWLKQHLGEHQIPVRWYALEEIPRTSRGKVNRDSVAEACSDMPPIDLRRVLTGA